MAAIRGEVNPCPVRKSHELDVRSGNLRRIVRQHNERARQRAQGRHGGLLDGDRRAECALLGCCLRERCHLRFVASRLRKPRPCRGDALLDRGGRLRKGIASRQQPVG